jgi:hypothetical protein
MYHALGINQAVSARRNEEAKKGFLSSLLRFFVLISQMCLARRKMPFFGARVGL